MTNTTTRRAMSIAKKALEELEANRKTRADQLMRRLIKGAKAAGYRESPAYMELVFKSEIEDILRKELH
jgi:DNA-binding transcriptional regulator YhcF (GntR family)